MTFPELFPKPNLPEILIIYLKRACDVDLFFRKVKELIVYLVKSNIFTGAFIPYLRPCQASHTAQKMKFYIKDFLS